MARVAAAKGGNPTGLYAWLLDYEEAAVLTAGRLPSWSLQPGWHGTPERLAAMRAGEPVSVNAGRLPHWARDAVGERIAALTYVRVYADDRVELLEDAGGRLFCEEQGL